MKEPVTLCALPEKTIELIESYVDALKKAAPSIGEHGMDEADFWNSGLFVAAVEKLRGSHAATMDEKKAFIAAVLEYMKNSGDVSEWNFEGQENRHDYKVIFPGNKICIIEAKGCLDGNNTNIFKRPKNADEFLIWSLCQNPGSDPRHNAWSGIHTRLSAEMVSREEKVDALIIWDMLCGALRECPKLKDSTRGTDIGGLIFPPPCIYLFPRSIPDPRNNPKPPVWQLKELGFVSSLAKRFKCDESDIVSVSIEADMRGSDVIRKTTLYRDGVQIHQSGWTKIKRAR